MRYSPSEKLGIIRTVEDSELSTRQTLKELGIHRITFYNLYHRYLENGVESLRPKKPKAKPSGTRSQMKSKSRLFVRL
jgi:putative transposase